MQTLSQWMEHEKIPGIQGIDTRMLTKKIREKGTILGRIEYELPLGIDDIKISDPNARNLVEEVSVKVRKIRNQIKFSINNVFYC